MYEEGGCYGSDDSDDLCSGCDDSCDGCGCDSDDGDECLSYEDLVQLISDMINSANGANSCKGEPVCRRSAPSSPSWWSSACAQKALEGVQAARIGASGQALSARSASAKSAQFGCSKRL